eukprot:COSAG01_NODE_43826_length_425_cov_9.496933_1_plen_41_part_10
MHDEAAKLCLGREQKCGAGRGVRPRRLASAPCVRAAGVAGW